MLRPFLVLCISCIVGQSAVTKHKLECGPNEVYKCVGCPPEDSCYDRYQFACPAAFLPCTPSCVCKEGFIRKTLDRECIPKEECGTPCDTFEEYTDCKQCANETCSSITNPVKQSCDDKQACTPGCKCWAGYYRADEDSTCLAGCRCPDLDGRTKC